jgi:hypothetical protein
MRFESLADYWEPFLLGQGPAGAYVSRFDRAKSQALRNEVKRRLFLPVEDVHELSLVEKLSRSGRL